ncbi:hypothetical protein NCCP1664_24580 [Zafaria cholistanensis]|uniref:Uncharacterized protein n=1 Tax=Zafaria cholistanensis TaxID=1682741 RepID=A0A5A7NT56_9MICC|nr:hypothetical protein NCCP1664_24580 [Zafaria cholistanensis]
MQAEHVGRRGHGRQGGVAGSGLDGPDCPLENSGQVGQVLLGQSLLLPGGPNTPSQLLDIAHTAPRPGKILPLQSLTASILPVKGDGNILPISSRAIFKRIATSFTGRMLPVGSMV